MANSRDIILQKIKDALSNPSEEPYPDLAQMASGKLYPPAGDEDLALRFAEEFSRLGGHFSWCQNLKEAVDQMKKLADAAHFEHWYCKQKDWKDQLEKNGWQRKWTEDLANCHVAVTGCESLVARTGSIMLSTRGSGGRASSVYAPVHVCLAFAHQLVYDIGDALDDLQEKYGEKIPSSVTLASGPSRTADIEKTLVTGVHGPKEVFCFLIENQPV